MVTRLDSGFNQTRLDARLIVLAAGPEFSCLDLWKPGKLRKGRGWLRVAMRVSTWRNKPA